MKFNKLIAITITIGSCLSFTASAATIVINFDTGGINGTAVGAFYASQGITFSNVAWYTNRDERGQPYDGSTGAFVVSGLTSNVYPKSNSPLIALFDIPLSSFSILATDLGNNGARVDAYDAVVGGNLLTFDQAFFGDVGVGVSRNMVVQAPNIRRVEIYQPRSISADGIVWDNVTAITVPEPTSTVFMLCGGLSLLAHRRRNSNRNAPPLPFERQ